MSYTLTGLWAENAKLKRRIRLLERDRMQARELLLPGQVLVYRAIMRYWRALGTSKHVDWQIVMRACARAEREGKRKGAK